MEGGWLSEMDAVLEGTGLCVLAWSPPPSVAETSTLLPTQSTEEKSGTCSLVVRALCWGAQDAGSNSLWVRSSPNPRSLIPQASALTAEWPTFTSKYACRVILFHHRAPYLPVRCVKRNRFGPMCLNLKIKYLCQDGHSDCGCEQALMGPNSDLDILV